jgi:O-antigen/teichoic acid export membrane protein
MEHTLNINNSLLQKFQGDNIEAVLARGASGTLTVMVAGAGIGFATQVILARLLGVKQYGQYGYVISWLMILILPCKLGMEMTLVRFLSAYRARKEWELLYGIVQFAKKSTIGASIVVAGITALVIWAIRYRINDPLALTFWFGCAIIPILTMLHIYQSSLRAFHNVILARLSESIIQPLSLISLVIIVGIFTKIRLNAPLVMAFHGITLLMALLLASKWLTQSMSRIPKSTIVKTDPKEWLAVGLPLLMMGGFSLVIQRADIIMIGAYLGTTKAGVYIAVVRLANLLVLGLTAANFIAAPLISELHAQDKNRELQKIISKIALGLCGLTLPVAAGMIIFSSWLLKLFGNGFESGNNALLILIGGQSANALFGSVGYLLTMTGYQRHALLAMGSSACLNLVMNATLIPLMGINGAAIATTSSIIFWNVIMYIMVRRHLNLDPTIISVIRKIL